MTYNNWLRFHKDAYRGNGDIVVQQMYVIKMSLNDIY